MSNNSKESGCHSILLPLFFSFTFVRVEGEKQELNFNGKIPQRTRTAKVGTFQNSNFGLALSILKLVDFFVDRSIGFIISVLSRGYNLLPGNFMFNG